MPDWLRGFLADTLLVVHFAYVAFVVVGLVLFWIGYWRRWRWVRNFWVRALHLLAIGIVMVESVFGITCPLTVWEQQLRQGTDGAYTESFLQHWIHKIMFFELGPSTFLVIYVVFFALVVLTFVLFPPRWPRRVQEER